MTPGPATDHATDPAPHRQSGWRTLPVAIMAGMAALLGIGLVVALATRPDVSGPSQPVHAAEATPTTAEPSTVTYGKITPDLIQLDLLVTSQKCYGTAGCLVEFEIVPGFLPASQPIEPGSRWLVTYEVAGAEDPFINNFEIHVMSSDETGADLRYTTAGLAGRVSTPPAPIHLAASVTAVRRR